MCYLDIATTNILFNILHRHIVLLLCCSGLGSKIYSSDQFDFLLSIHIYLLHHPQTLNNKIVHKYYIHGIISVLTFSDIKLFVHVVDKGGAG